MSTSNYMEAIKKMVSNGVVSSMIPAPNADKQFIDKYNSVARANKFAANLYRSWNPAAARFHDALGVEINTDRDIWEGLDYEVVMELGKDRLLHVKGKPGTRENFYFSPPEAGHASNVVHTIIDPNHELSNSLLRNGLQYGDVYVLDKRGIKKEHGSFSLDDCVKRSVDAIEYIARETGKKVNVAGFCQGGWEGLLAAYLTKDNVKSVASGGTPFHWHSKDLSDLTKSFSSDKVKQAKVIAKNRALVKDLIDRNEGIMPGTWNLLGFIELSKDQLMKKDIEKLWEDAVNNNVEGLKRFSEFRTGWFMKPQGMGGKFFLDVFDKFYTEDQLFNGGLEILGEEINLDKFDLPMYCLNGTRDHITSRGQQMDLFERISTDLSYLVEDSVDAGHLGVFNGSKAMSHWNAWFGTVAHPDFEKKSFSARDHYASILRAA